MRIIFSLVILIQITNYCHGQVEYNPCQFFEEFFSEVRFEEIPYYTRAVLTPDIPHSESKDSIIEVFDYETYESKFVNQKTLITEQWDKFNYSQKFVSKRDLEKKSFHLINSNVELRKPEYIKTVVAKYFSELSIDTSNLYRANNLKTCEIFDNYNNENFKSNKTLDSLTDEQLYNLRGYFSFGSTFLTDDKMYAITTFDIYHKWINSKGVPTSMETGSGGILIINLSNKQVIEKIQYLWEY